MHDAITVTVVEIVFEMPLLGSMMVECSNATFICVVQRTKPVKH